MRARATPNPAIAAGWPALDALPVFGVCGRSGAGKTTLLERIVRHFCERGLRVAVVKHYVHGVKTDVPGKDSDRFFRAGADALLQGPAEEFLRAHGTGDHRLVPVLRGLARRYDLVLVEGHKGTPLAKAWLLSEGETEPPPGTENVAAVLPREAGRFAALRALLEAWLPRRWLEPPVYGCVLIGGGSTRFGKPKHLMVTRGATWLERTLRCLGEVAVRTAITGGGPVPPSLESHPRLPDVPDAAGPLAGILAAMRWAPEVSWLVAACDLPWLSGDALRWLLSTRAPGVWATVPMLPGESHPEPLLAHYDFRAHHLLEELAARGDFCPARIVANPHIISPCPPSGLAGAWRNVNAEGDLGGVPLQAKTPRKRNVSPDRGE